MTAITVRKVRDLYNFRVPKEGLDLLGIKEGDLIQVDQVEDYLIVRKFTGAKA